MLHEKMSRIGIVDFGEAKKQYSEQLSKLAQSIYDARADLAQYRATIIEIQTRYPVVAAAGTNTTKFRGFTDAAPGQDFRYEAVCRNLESLQLNQDSMLTHLTTNSPLVRAAQAGLDKIRGSKEKLEADWPALVSIRPTESKAPVAATGPTAQQQLNDASLKASGLMARIAVLTNAMAEVQSNVTGLNTMEGTVTGLKTTKEAEEASYKSLLESVGKARIGNAIGPGRVSNIGDVETPTPPVRDIKKMLKMIGGMAVGGVVLAFGLAFAIELYFNRTFRHPIDVQTRLPFPFFVSIPKTNGHARLRLANPAAASKLALPPSRAVEPNGAVVHSEAPAGEVIATAPDVASLDPWRARRRCGRSWRRCATA